MDWIADKIKKAAAIAGTDSPFIDGSTGVISASRFSNIQKNEAAGRAAFIDGGSAEIISGQSFAAFFIRLCCVIFKGKERFTQTVKEGFVFTNLISESDNLKIRISSEKLIDEFEIAADDADLRSGKDLVSVGQAANLARRLSELKMCLAVQDANDLVILDGMIEAKHPLEEKITSGFSKNVIGLCKTDKMLTRKGTSLAAYLDQISPYKAWHYKAALREKLQVSFAKLSKESGHVFRIDSSNDSDIAVYLSILAAHSRDPVFPGYPYGLILADKLGRVSNQEKEQLRLKLMARLGKDLKKIAPFINSGNAHSILDSIS